MKLFTPIVSLVKQENPGSSDDFFIHVITVTDQTDYQSNGHGPIPTSTDTAGFWQIEIFIKKDDTLPDFELLTPIVHTISLGSSPFIEEGKIKITVSEDDPIEGIKKVGDSIADTASAEVDSRPIPGRS